MMFGMGNGKSFWVGLAICATPFVIVGIFVAFCLFR